MSHRERPYRPHDVNAHENRDGHDGIAEADVAAEFDALRGRLMGIAYGLLGSVDDAEDVVQESWLRLRGTDRDRIQDLTGWLIVTVSRIAQDVLKSARRNREEYVGQWLPEPLITAAPAQAAPEGDPADRITLDESLSMALMVVLEALSPAERTAFVLHDVFGLSFAEVGRAVGRTPAACRQLAARARRHAAARAPRFEVSPDDQRHVVAAFSTACQEGDIAALLSLLDPDVVLRTDGGGVVRAALNPIRGADKVARYLSGVFRRLCDGQDLVPVAVNGLPGLMWGRGEAMHGVFGITVSQGRITELGFVRNPDKLGRVRGATAPRP